VGRLVLLLPCGAGHAAGPGRTVQDPTPTEHAPRILWIYAILMLLLMSAQWLSARNQHAPPDPLAQTAPGSVVQSVPSSVQPK